MRESPFPLEQELGMGFYASDTPGIGGHLRASADDFIVEEVPGAIGTEGPFLICRLTKRDWDQQRALREVARKLGISYKRIGFTGTKDRHAVTSQLISLKGIAPEEVEGVRVRDICLEPVGRSHSPLSLGSHLANRFTITIRDASADPDLIGAVNRVCAAGIPNYYGIQRFGAVRPVSHTTGAFILKGDYEGAVCHYVGASFPGEPGAVQEARTAFLEHRDPLRSVRELPLSLSYERAMLHHLAAHPGDYQGALRVLPPKLLSMLVSAYQSLLFNRALTLRLAGGGSLDQPLPGDRLVFAGGREDRVAPATCGSAAVQIRRGRCRIALRVPGCREDPLPCADTSVMELLMARDGIRASDFCSAADLVRARFDGASRPVALSTPVTSEISGDRVTLSFSLDPGQYATTVCREYMKTDPVRMV